MRKTVWLAATMRVFLLLGVIGISTRPGHGQDTLAGAAFGPSVLAGNRIVAEANHPVGLQASLLFLGRRWGIVADMGFSWRTTVAGVKYGEDQYLIGPEFNFRRKKSSILFVHTLAGVTDVGTLAKAEVPYCSLYVCHEEDFHSIHSPFTLGLGGGIMIMKEAFLPVRITADYLPHRLDGRWGHRFRVGIGVIFAFP